jgi:ABC-type branched-subunit amino acid transport system ATPase component
MQTPHKSISVNPVDGILPMLTVITGANGSGKSHFLEAIAEGKIWFEGLSGQPRMLGISDLQTIERFTVREEIRAHSVETLKSEVRSYIQSFGPGEDGGESVRNHLVGNNILSTASIAAAELQAGRPLAHWGEREFQAHTPMELGKRDLFQFSIATTFSTYNEMRTTNDFKEYRSSMFGDEVDWVSRSEFERIYGEPPWEVLNRVLASVGLPYTFIAPDPEMKSLYLEPRLIDRKTDRPVTTQELSSGEKTLLTIAMSIYSAEKRRDLVTMPSVLLLDEPDGTLHPSMVRSMLSLIRDEIVGGLNIPVILTTHSPTTIALADEDSIFIMRRNGQPRLRKATQDEALKSLLVGVPSLSVNAENRRVVVVESPNDERLYTSVMVTLASKISSERSLQFMAAGSKDLPNGCDAVIRLVAGMRGRGNSKVWGLVDRDNRTEDPEPHTFLNPERYSIENIVLDPLSLGLALLRDRNPCMINLLSPINYLSFSAEDIQPVIDAVVAELVGATDDTTLQDVLYSGGDGAVIPKFFLNENGHALEARVRKTFPALNQHRGMLLDYIVATVWSERPEVVPASVIDTFTRLLETE